MTDHARNTVSHPGVSTLGWVAVALLLGSLTGWWKASEVDRQMRADLLAEAQVMADNINLQDLAALSGTESDLAAPQYQRLKRQLQAARQAFPHWRFVYLMVQEPDGRVIFQIDSEAPDSPDESPPGDVHAEISAEKLRVFDPGVALTTGPAEDRWGVWVSALIPLSMPANRPGKLALGIDIDAGDWRRQVVVRAIVPVALATFVLLLIAATGHILLVRRAQQGTAKLRWLRFLEPGLVVAVGLVLTAVVSWIGHNHGQRDKIEAFTPVADAAAQGLTSNLRNLRDFGLDGLVRFFQASAVVTPQAFGQYTELLIESGLAEHFGWAPRVPASEREQFEQDMQDTGVSDFRIWELEAEGIDHAAETGRAFLYPLALATDTIEELAITGLDMASLPHLRNAIDAAQQSGMVTALAPLDGAYVGAFRGYMLVFQPTGPRMKPGARDGVVIASAAFDDMVTNWAANDTLDIELWLVQSDGSRQRLTEPRLDHLAASDTRILERPILMFGETFMVRVAPGAGFSRARSDLTGVFTALAGALLTLLLATVVAMVTRNREALEQAVIERTRTLQEFRTAVEQSAEGMVLTELDGTVRFANRAWAEMHGYTQSQTTGEHVGLFHTSEQLEKEVEPGFAQLLETGQLLTEMGHMDRQGNTFPTRMAASLIRDDDGKPLRILAIAQDISKELQQREQEQFNQQFRSIVADIAAGFISTADKRRFDDRLDEALASLGRVFAVDRAYLFQISENGKVSINTHEWCAPGIEPQKPVLQAVPVSDTAWWMAHWQEKKPIQIEDVQALPPEAASERQLLQSQSICSVVAVPMTDENGQLLGFIGLDSVREKRRWPDEQVSLLQAVADILAGALRRRQVMQDLADSEARFRELAEQSRTYRWQVNLEGLYTDIDPLATEILGYEPDDLVDKKHFYDLVPEEDRDQVRRDGLEQIQSGQPHTGYENRVQTKDGRILWVSTTILPLYDDNGQLIGVRGSDTDITERKQAELQLEYNAHHDLLTRLPNRSLLADRLQQAMIQANRRGELLGVACLDLDEFKPINDRFGHEVGDQLLVTVAERMQSALREGDTVARLGGDEFALVLVSLQDMEASKPMLQRLLDAVSAPIEHEGHQLKVTLSLGITFYPQSDTLDADQLLRQADQAMYQAKLTGRNRYHFFDADQDRQLRSANQQLDRIRTGLAQDEFLLYYQPKVDMKKGRVVGVEALVRWQHPQDGLLPPAAFLPALRQHNLMLELGNRVIELALKQINLWRKANISLPVSVNVDPLQLTQPDFIDELAHQLKQYPAVQPGDLELEVVETSAVDESTPMAEIIKQASELGVRFSLDDFGTGYSSLSYLKQLPVATLKIDRSFVRDMLIDPDDLAILRGIISLANTFRQSVIAEGVETEAHGTMLLQLGCVFGQGYAIARPMPAADIPKWISQWQPASSWLVTKPVDNARLPLLVAIVEYSAWLDHIQRFLEGRSGDSTLLDHPASDFIEWLESGHPVATAANQAIGETLEQLQVKAQELLHLARTGQAEQARTRIDDLKARTDHFLAKVKTRLYRDDAIKGH